MNETALSGLCGTRPLEFTHGGLTVNIRHRGNCTRPTLDAKIEIGRAGPSLNLSEEHGIKIGIETGRAKNHNNSITEVISVKANLLINS